MDGFFRVVVAFLAMAAMLAFWAVVLPGAVMLIVLYIFRAVPLTGWRKRSK